MIRPRVSIIFLMALVSLVALNTAAIQYLDGAQIYFTNVNRVTTSINLILLAMGVLPMASLLALCVLMALPGILRRTSSASFLVGFEVFGWGAVFAFTMLGAVEPQGVLEFAYVLMNPIGNSALGRRLTAVPDWAGKIIECTCLAIVYTVPELLFAVIGGWATRRLGIVLERRRRKQSA
jgi:hypothetical protein